MSTSHPNPEIDAADKASGKPFFQFLPVGGGKQWSEVDKLRNLPGRQNAIPGREVYVPRFIGDSVVDLIGVSQDSRRPGFVDPQPGMMDNRGMVFLRDPDAAQGKGRNIMVPIDKLKEFILRHHLNVENRELERDASGKIQTDPGTGYAKLKYPIGDPLQKEKPFINSHGLIFNLDTEQWEPPKRAWKVGELIECGGGGGYFTPNIYTQPVPGISEGELQPVRPGWAVARYDFETGDPVGPVTTLRAKDPKGRPRSLSTGADEMVPEYQIWETGGSMNPPIYKGWMADNIGMIWANAQGQPHDDMNQPASWRDPVDGDKVVRKNPAGGPLFRYVAGDVSASGASARKEGSKVAYAQFWNMRVRDDETIDYVKRYSESPFLKVLGVTNARERGERTAIATQFDLYGFEADNSDKYNHEYALARAAGEMTHSAGRLLKGAATYLGSGLGVGAVTMLAAGGLGVAGAAAVACVAGLVAAHVGYTIYAGSKWRRDTVPLHEKHLENDIFKTINDVGVLGINAFKHDLSNTARAAGTLIRGATGGQPGEDKVRMTTMATTAATIGMGVALATATLPFSIATGAICAGFAGVAALSAATLAASRYGKDHFEYLHQREPRTVKTINKRIFEQLGYDDFANPRSSPLDRIF